MELGGDNLGRFISQLRADGQTMGPSIDIYTMKSFWQQLVSIVLTLHRNSVIHMDLKPENLILFGPILKIADLGVSRKIGVVG
jgi:serine/threonine protein kinase